MRKVILCLLSLLLLCTALCAQAESAEPMFAAVSGGPEAVNVVRLAQGVDVFDSYTLYGPSDFGPNAKLIVGLKADGTASQWMVYYADDGSVSCDGPTEMIAVDNALKALVYPQLAGKDGKQVEVYHTTIRFKSDSENTQKSFFAYDKEDDCVYYWYLFCTGADELFGAQMIELPHHDSLQTAQAALDVWLGRVYPESGLKAADFEAAIQDAGYAFSRTLTEPLAGQEAGSYMWVYCQNGGQISRFSISKISE